jgi:predicted nucleotidyltransferase
MPEQQAALDHGLPPAAVQRICATLAGFPAIEQATLYGSRAMGRYRPGSDIDLTLSGDGLDGRLLAQVDAALDDLLLPWRFDLSLRSQLQAPALLDHIARVGQVLYRRG